MNWILISVFPVLLQIVYADLSIDRLSNAAEVVQRSVAVYASVDKTGVNEYSSPIVSPRSKMLAGMAVLGSLLKESQSKSNNFKQSLKSLEAELERLDTSMNKKFSYLDSVLKQKQLQSEAITVLWKEIRSFISNPTEQDFNNIEMDCKRNAALEIAKKIHASLISSSNSTLSVLKGVNYQKFVVAKDIIMYRMFQTMIMESFCVGVQNGPDYKIPEAPEFLQLHSLYSNVKNAVSQSMPAPNFNYFPSVIPGIVSSIVEYNAKGKQRVGYAEAIYDQLTSQYGWDTFGVIIADYKCDQISVTEGNSYRSGNTPYAYWYSGWDNPQIPLDVYVIRFWSQGAGTLQRDLTDAMKKYYKNNIEKWTDNIYDNTNYEFILLDSSWFCGGSTVFYGSSTANYGEEGKYSDGTADGIIPYNVPPTGAAHSMFSERDIDLNLIVH